MIKDKLEKCADTSNNIQIKEEPTSSCDSTSKETGGNEPAIPIKEEDAPSSSTASTANVKESPGSRGTGTVSSRPNSSSNANAGPTTNGNNSNPVCPTTNAPPPMGVGHPAALPAVPDPTDVTSILDSASDVVVPPGGPGGIPDETVINDRTPLPPDLQTDTFNELGPSNMPPNMRQPGMIQPQQPHNIRPSPNGIQPLVSNVINKTQQATGGNNMEVQYMQQQSQIFVFSTMLANKSADAVFQGHFQSIIAYHCAQPGTKKYFEKHPLKLTQFHRQNPAQWLNGLAMMKNKGCARGGGNMGGGGGPQQGPPGGMPGLPNFPPKPGGGSMGMVDNFPGHDGIVDDIASLQESDVPWEQRPNHQMGMPVPPNAGPDGTGPLSDPSLDDACLAGTSTAPGAPGNANTALMLGHSPCITSTAPTSPSLAGLEPSLQGVKVPDEDLTPQQRQHREEQLATLRKMQQMLFPEENTGAMNIGDEHEMGGNATDTPGGGPPGNCPGMMPATSMPGHMEWQKLQNQFFDSKIKQEGPIGPGLRGMVPMPPGLPPGSGSVLSPQVPGSGQGPRLQGPPPPYHQTPRSASVPIALQSPSPASPNNPTSNLSLPSPRTSSALNSPADSNNRQQFSGLNRHFSATQSPTSQSSPSGPNGGPRGTNTISNPGTPISSHFSPSATTPATDSLTVQASSGNGGTSSEFTGAGGPGVVTSTHHGVDGMFCRTLQSMAQKQHMVSGVPPGSTDISGSPNKEPNLMPVPSPQQIQYCNTFEGQELTIQKQPNTSLKDRNITSPPSLESGFPGEMCSGGGNNGTRVSAPNTPLTPSSVDMGPRFPINTTNPQSDCYRLPAPSPNSIDSKNPRPSPQGPGNPRPSNDPNNMKSNNPEANNVRFSNASPLDGHNRYPIMGVGGSPNAFAQQQQQQQQKPQQPPGGNPGGGNMMAVSPSGKPNDIPISTSGQRADNVPLNPNSNNGLPGNPKGSHFDPISSLAQMSQLLTSTSSLNGQPPGSGPSMMPYGGVNASPMDMGRPDMGCVPDLDGGMMGMGPGGPHVYNSGSIGSPKNMPFMSPQRIMRPQMGQMPPYNGTNVQVKASAPNTIQYLPARPQMGPQNPRGPPCLEFLRFANPNMDGKNIGAQNMQYFPGCGPSNNMGHMEGGGGPMHNDGIMASLMNGPPMMGKMGPMSGGMVPQGMMPMGMGGGPNMRNPGGPGGLRPGMNPSIRMHGGMGGFDSSGLGGDGMYPPSGPGGPQMFGPGMGGPKGPMGRGMCAPDASQPLPPSVGQTNAYKSSPFGAGATTADPNYAQQFHNFQQQLYATSTRSQLNSQGPGPPQGPPQGGPPGMYFMSK